MSYPKKQWFVPGDGIAREVITADIQRYLGPDALVKPGKGSGSQEGVDGYWITAYRTLTSTMVEDLKLDSRRWHQEVRQGRVKYQESDTHLSRQHYGPSTTQPAPQAEQYAPQQSTYQQYATSYQQPPQQAYGEAYTHAPQAPSGYVYQGGQYVPAPQTGPSAIRTQPAPVQYSYTQPQQQEREPAYVQTPQYTYPPSTSAPAPQAYAPPQPSRQQQTYAYDERAYQQPQPSRRGQGSGGRQ